MNHKLFGLLGICRKANRIKLGFDPVVAALENEAVLILFAQDVSPKTKERLLFKAARYNRPHRDLSCTADELDLAIGKRVAVLAVTDRGLAQKIAAILDANDANAAVAATDTQPHD